MEERSVCIRKVAGSSPAGSIPRPPPPTASFARIDRITVNGAELAYQERGRGDPVVCVHGTGTYSATWWESTEALTATHRVITYDRRGYAASSGPLARGMAQHVDDLAELLRELEAAPAAVVGQSAAGVIVLGLAARHPELVRSIVLAEPANQLALFPSLGASAALGRAAIRALLQRDREAAAVGFYRWASSRPGGNGYDAMPAEWRETATGHATAVLREIVQLVPPAPRAKALRAIRQPATIVITDGGQAVFRRTTRRVTRLLPNARLVEVPGAGHLIPTDKPQELGDVLVSELDAPRTPPAAAAGPA